MKAEQRSGVVPGSSLHPADLPPGLIQVLASPEPTLWVFGYGSLIWNPGFRFSHTLRGFVCGYERRFSQGNFTHRGSKDQPGRVVTIVPAEGKQTFGLLFQVSGEADVMEALEHLYVREIQSGYEFLEVPVTLMDKEPVQNDNDVTTASGGSQTSYSLVPNGDQDYGTGVGVPQIDQLLSSEVEVPISENTSDPTIIDYHQLLPDGSATITTASSSSNRQVPALTVVALPENSCYVGHAEESLDCVAGQIAAAHGPAGHNSEYLLKLADYMKAHFPGESDEHLFELESRVMKRLIQMRSRIECACDIRGVNYTPGEVVRLPPLPDTLTMHDLSI